jgi:hypothetical protein
VVHGLLCANVYFNNHIVLPLILLTPDLGGWCELNTDSGMYGGFLQNQPLDAGVYMLGLQWGHHGYIRFFFPSTRAACATPSRTLCLFSQP